MAVNLTHDEIRLAVDLIKQVSRMATMIPAETAGALVRARDLEDTLMPLLDPTLWQRTSRQTEWHMPYLRAFATYRAELDRIAKQYGPPPDAHEETSHG